MKSTYNGGELANHSHSTESIAYLLNHAREKPFDPQLPSLSKLSGLLNISVSRLGEQVEVAKSMGFVEVRPRTRIKRLPCEFSSSVLQSLLFGIELDPEFFVFYSGLRKKMELSYWDEAEVLSQNQTSRVYKVLSIKCMKNYEALL